MDTKETVIEILEDLCGGVDFENCTTLVDDRILTSLTMVALVAELEDAFDIEIPPVHVVADNFNSAQAICNLVEKLQDEDFD